MNKRNGYYGDFGSFAEEQEAFRKSQEEEQPPCDYCQELGYPCEYHSTLPAPKDTDLPF